MRRGMREAMKSRGRGSNPTRKQATPGRRSSSSRAKVVSDPVGFKGGPTKRRSGLTPKPDTRGGSKATVSRKEKRMVAEPVKRRTSAYKEGGMAKSSCGTKKAYASGGKVRGAGMCKKGVRPAKNY